MNFLDIELFDFIGPKDSLLQYRRKSDFVTLSAYRLSGAEWTNSVNESFFQNLEAVNLMSHPNIVKCIGHSIRDTDQGNELLIFMENSEGTLDDFLESEILTKDDIKNILRDTISTLIAIEEKMKMSPYYISPKNIIVSKNYFGDNTFKLFCPMQLDCGINLGSTEAKWVSPELFEKLRFEGGPLNLRTHSKSIVYSLGLLSIFMIHGEETLIQNRDFFNYDEFVAQIKETEDKNIRKYIADTAGQLKDPQLMDLILKMLKFSPAERPTCQEVLKKLGPSESASLNQEVREPPNSRPAQAQGQDRYAIFVDERNQIAQNQRAGNVDHTGRTNQIRGGPCFRVIRAPNFDRKTFTFVVTTFQILVFLLTEFKQFTSENPGCVLFYYGASYTPSINFYYQFYRLFTPIFLHAGLLHIIMNMTGQYYMGFTLEKFVGIKDFSLIYIISGIIGNLVASAMNVYSMGVGASTSLFGLFHLNFLLDLQHMNVKAAEKKYLRQLIFCFLFSLLPGISFYGHFGGWIGGVLISTILVNVQQRYYLSEFLRKYAKKILIVGSVCLLAYIMMLKDLGQAAMVANQICGSFF